MLVGDLIISARELMPDLPRGVLNPPVGFAAAAVGSAGATIPTGTYNVLCTAVNAWGETLASNTVAGVAITVNVHGIQVTAPALSSIPGATKLRVYFGLNTALAPNQWIESSVIPFTIVAPGNPGQAPIRPTAFYPDSDGGMVSAFTVYRWINEALEEASKLAGGIPDMTAVATDVNVGLYTLEGLWHRLSQCWYDGYPVAITGKNDLYYLTRTQASLPFIAVAKIVSNRVVVEAQNPPDRTSFATTLAAPMTISDAQAQLVSAAGFDQSYSLALIGTEIVAPSNISGNNLNGLIRGVGGTVQSAWPGGTPVRELNLRFEGLRYFSNPQYAVGNALSTLPVPFGWRTPLINFLVGKFREAEQDFSEASKKFQTFAQLITQTAKGNRITAGPRQVGHGLDDSFGRITTPGLGSLGGGVVVP